MEYPLQVIGDPRFQTIITRAVQRARVAPVLERDVTQSERSSWSSASVVSSTYCKSPEPRSQDNQMIENLVEVKTKSRNRKLCIAFGIIIIVLILIGIILVTALLLTSKNNSPTAYTTVATYNTNHR